MHTVSAPVSSYYSYVELEQALSDLFCATGMQTNIAKRVTDSLLIAEMMGHLTHGLALAPWYLEAARTGSVTLSGGHDVVVDRGACVTWDGRRLPGAWLISSAIDLAIERAEQFGTVTIAIFNCHHTGALATYLPKLTSNGLMGILASSGPAAKVVAPFGGTEGLLTPNPIAAGIPTEGDPILLDISSSITTLNNARQLARVGERFPQQWALDAKGNPSDDPGCVISGGGTLLPVGGLDHGHKGYSMSLLIETLTQALPGYGRADNPTGTLTGVYLHVIDPQAFSGFDAFTRQSSWLADACRSNRPRTGVERVRVPGERASQRMREARQEGVCLSESVYTALIPYADEYKVQLPSPAR
ncbi:Ldh family oxidoreductase [Advenella kashmirensis]